MTLPLRIDIEQFDLANEKVTEPIHLYIELAEHSLIYAAEYYGEEPAAEDQEDHSLGWKEMYQNFHIKIKREVLVSLDINWVNKRELWRVELEANGYPNSIKFYFKKEKDARKVWKQLDEYIFGEQ